MSDHVPSWMPSDETLRATAHNCTLYATCNRQDPMEDLRDVIEEAVEKALAEQKQQLERRHNEFWNALLTKREARHKREVLEARLEVLEEANARQYPYQSILDQLDRYNAELAALDAGEEAKP